MTKYLTREEELALIIKAQSGDRSAEAELLERHKDFIWKSAIRYHSRSSNALDVEDCAQIAAIGVLKAIRLFDVNSGVVLLTFAFPCVQSEFSIHLQYNGVIKCPRKQKRIPVKFLDGMGTEGESLAHTIPARMYDWSERNEDVREGRKYLEMLSGRERDIVERRMNGETLNEISVTYGISKERIRQLEALGMRKLRLIASMKEKVRNGNEGDNKGGSSGTGQYAVKGDCRWKTRTCTPDVVT